VLGFPSNDFGSQEPGSNRAIAEFCENTFNVRFPMFVKTAVAGRAAPAHPLYEQLARQSGQRPGWNFHKYLVSRDTRTVISHTSQVEPQDRKLIADLEKLLDAK
jgi:glutathione peroxidase